MALRRKVISPIGLLPRTRSTLLLTAPVLPADVLMDESGIPRWLAGVTFQQLGCDPLSRIQGIICGDVTGFEKVANDLGDHIEFDSFAVYDAKEGSMLCLEQGRLVADIEIRMPAMVSEQLAAELMVGGARPVDGGNPLVNPTLASVATVAPGGPFLPGEAMAELEAAAATTLHGAEATFHITPRGMSHLTFLDIADGLNGPIYRTSQGHTVIADAGYTGPAPDAQAAGIESEWWYMSGPVFWALTPFGPLGMPEERVNIANNQLTEIMEAFAIVVFDPCAVVAVPVMYESDGGS